MNVELEKLREKRQKFTQGDMEVKEAITNVSHDLRTPLTAICGYLDLLEGQEKSEEVERYLAIIRSRTDSLKRLTEELFQYTIVNSTTGELLLEDVSINDVLEESISGYYAALKGCQITPAIHIPETKVVRYLNRNALLRILGNLISNAIKYSDGDLEITLNEEGEILFANQSSTLNEVEVEKLFDRFYTVETAKKSNGLGLAIARMLTEQMDGEIKACYIQGRVEIRICFKNSKNY